MLDLQRTDVGLELVARLKRALGSSWGTCDFSLARISHAQSFEGLTFGAGTSFFGAIFGNNVSFSPATFLGDVDFSCAWFGASADLAVVRVEGNVNLSQARFQDVNIQFIGSNRDLAIPDSRRTLDLSGTTFVERTRIEWLGGPVDIDMSRTVFIDGFLLRAIGSLKAESVYVGRRSLIMGLARHARSLAVHSLDGMDLAQLTLSGVDMSEFESPYASDLSQLRFEGDIRFKYRGGGFRTSRKVLKQELGSEKREPSSAAVLAGLYRGIRKASEESKDFSGASDFYYGEMEMRRRSLARAKSLVQHSERLLLTLYWIFGGYGVRPLRPFLGLLALITGLAGSLYCFGFVGDASGGTALRQSLLITLSFLRPPGSIVPLTTVGFYLSILARCVTPILIAFWLLGLRSRVKR
jgi:uncharacterized protein YjbI with pentapeptide repeats